MSFRSLRVGSLFDSTLKAGCAALGLILALVCYYFLLSYGAGADSAAISGELFIGEGRILETSKGGIEGFLFDYFGAVTYLFPLIIVHLGFALPKIPLSLRRLNLYRAGLYILGIDFGILGFSVIFSKLFSLGRTGGGGVLGDFFTLTGQDWTSPAVTALAALTLALGGVFLVIGRSPVFVAEKLGALVTSLVLKQRSLKGEDNSEDLKKPKEDPFAPSFSSPKTDNADDAVQSPSMRQTKGHKNEPKDPKSALFDREEPSFGDDLGTGNFDAAKEPYFGSADGRAGQDFDSKSQEQKTAAMAGQDNLQGSAQGQGAFAGEDTNEEAQAFMAEAAYLDSRAAAVYENNNGGTATGTDGSQMLSEGSSPEASQHQSADYDAPIYARSPYAPIEPLVPQSDNNREFGTATIITRAGDDSNAPEDNGNEAATIITTPWNRSSATPPQKDESLKDAPAFENSSSDALRTEEVKEDYDSRPSYLRTSSSQENIKTSGDNEGRIIDFNAGSAPGTVSFDLGDFSGPPPSQGGGHDIGRDAEPSYQENGNFLKSKDALRPKPSISEQDVRKLYGNAERGVFSQAGRSKEPDEKDDPYEHHNQQQSFDESYGSSSDDKGQGKVPLSTAEMERRMKENLAALSRDLEQAQRTLLTSPKSQVQKDEPAAASEQESASFAKQQSSLQNLNTALRGSSSFNSDAALTYNNNGSGGEPSGRQEEPLAPASGAASGYQEGLQSTPSIFAGENFAGDSAGSFAGSRGSYDNTQGQQGQGGPSGKLNSAGFDIKPIPFMVTCPLQDDDGWLPDLALIDCKDLAFEVDEAECDATAELLDRYLNEYNARAKVAGYLAGPVVTCYELETQPGVKASTVSNLAPDIGRKLMVETLRIIDMVPGTAYMGVEVPNRDRKIIYLGALLRSLQYQSSTAALPISLGVNAQGVPVVVNLAKAPHLLICGTTGSGKSVGLQAILISLLMRLSPQHLRLVLIDPKRVELSFYEDLPHLLTPVISDVEEKAGVALNWCVEEMERRYELLKLFKVVKIEEYNALIRQHKARGEVVYDPSWDASMGGTRPGELKELPYIVICVEEYADLMSQFKGRKGGNTPELSIARLAQKGRAAGIHMILATQTPRSDVVTSVIKANIPSRIAFTVQNGIDSRVILDENGAEKLLGNGDMIFKFPDVQRGQAVRAHSGFIANEDIKRVVQAWHDHLGDPQYVESVTEVPEEEGDDSMQADGSKLDKRFDEAAAFVRDFIMTNKKNPPVSLVQVELGVGYPRARRLVEQLKREGVLLPE